MREYFGGLNLVAVDDQTGATLYQGANGKSLLLYADGQAITVDPETKEPIWLTPMQAEQVKADISTSGQSPKNVISETKQQTQDAIDAGFITADEAAADLRQRGFIKVDEADIAKATGVVGAGETEERKLAEMSSKYYDPIYATIPEVVQAYRQAGLGQPDIADVIKYVGKGTPEQVTTGVKENLTTAQYNALQNQISESQRVSGLQQNLQNLLGVAPAGALSLLSGTPTVVAEEDKTTPIQPFFTSQIKQQEFESPLEQFMKTTQTGDFTETPLLKPSVEPQTEVAENMQPGGIMPSYFTYGEPTDIDRLFSPPTGFATNFNPFGQPMMAAQGGLATPLMAAGGLPVVHHAGKMRTDFRSGAAVSGPGDGQSDDIPAMLADGEFVIPADVVAALGNGSTKAGSDKLYDMMHSIRAHHRSAKPKDLPPAAKKSPLDYLTSRNKARR